MKSFEDGLQELSLTVQAKLAESLANPQKIPFESRLRTFSSAVQETMPVESKEYYERTNDMHCNPDSPGGSKFATRAEGGVDDILGVIEKMGTPEFVVAIRERRDDREALMQAGAPENAFLPATKTEGMPEGLPEALYFKVDGIKGTVGIIQVSELDPSTPVKVLQEKEKAPLSFSVKLAEGAKLPETDFATIIVGRSPGSNKDEVWTIHPGAPIRPATAEGFKHGQETTVQALLDAGIKPEDYIKIMG